MRSRKLPRLSSSFRFRNSLPNETVRSLIEKLPRKDTCRSTNAPTFRGILGRADSKSTTPSPNSRLAGGAKRLAMPAARVQEPTFSGSTRSHQHLEPRRNRVAGILLHTRNSPRDRQPRTANFLENVANAMVERSRADEDVTARLGKLQQIPRSSRKITSPRSPKHQGRPRKSCPQRARMAAPRPQGRNTPSKGAHRQSPELMGDLAL